MRNRRTSALLAMIGVLLLAGAAGMPRAQAQAGPTPTPASSPPEPPSRLEVQAPVRDEEIQARLQNILEATGWFIAPLVHVQDGVVFLTGQAQTEEYKVWAGNLARNTQDVAAVVNQLDVVEPPLLDFQPFVTGLRDQGRIILRALPLLGFSLVVLALAWLVSRWGTRGLRVYLHRRNVNQLLLNVIARGAGLLIFLGGLYLVFQVAGLTNVAFTILGGTGLLGLVLGIAFRDITENFLASIFLSVQNPFTIGDLVEIEGVQGFVQRMNTRTTILMTLAGNHVQIPNATVYKSVIHNYTSNPNRRIEFMLGIGYDDSISLAQETIRRVLKDHPAVLDDPESLVLVDSLGTATVNLQIYFWIDGTTYSWLKVKSSLIRLVKRAIQDAGVSMPDEAREIIFPKGVPFVRDTDTEPSPRRAPAEPPAESIAVSTSAEGDLSSEAAEIETQSRQSRAPEAGQNLLKPDNSESQQL